MSPQSRLSGLPKNPGRPTYISTREAGRRAGLSPRTIIRWLNRGSVDGYREGSQVVRIDAASLDRYLDLLRRAREHRAEDEA